MLRVAWGLFASAFALLGGAALGIVGAWALPLSAVGVTLGAIVVVVVMEGRDLDSADVT
jgi:hypothetical protein